jgi:hypothetical protein
MTWTRPVTDNPLQLLADLLDDDDPTKLALLKASEDYEVTEAVKEVEHGENDAFRADVLAKLDRILELLDKTR